MKKPLFYISLLLSIILILNISKIIVLDFQRLTNYGLGYLTGKVVLLMVLFSIIFFTRKSVVSSKS